MNSESQFSLWVNSELKEKFDLMVNEVGTVISDVTKKGIVEYLLQEWNTNKSLREAFIKKYKEDKRK
jgi:hypothetical protein